MPPFSPCTSLYSLDTDIDADANPDGSQGDAELDDGSQGSIRRCRGARGSEDVSLEFIGYSDQGQRAQLVGEVCAAMEPYFQAQTQLLLAAFAQLQQPGTAPKEQQDLPGSLAGHELPHGGGERAVVSPDRCQAADPEPAAKDPAATTPADGERPSGGNSFRSSSFISGAGSHPDRANHLVVKINGSDGADLGCSLSVDNDELIIGQISENSPVTKWNIENMAQEVSTGDRIINVNGYRGKGEFLLSMINNFFKQHEDMRQTLAMTVLRRQSPPQSFSSGVSPHVPPDDADAPPLSSLRAVAPDDLCDGVISEASVRFEEVDDSISVGGLSRGTQGTQASKSIVSFQNNIFRNLPNLPGCFQPCVPTQAGYHASGAASPARSHVSHASDVSGFSGMSACTHWTLHRNGSPNRSRTLATAKSAVSLLRVEHEAEILHHMHKEGKIQACIESLDAGVHHDSTRSRASPAERHVQSPALLRFCGIVPWGPARLCSKHVPYHWFVVVIMALLVAASGEQFYHVQQSSCPGGACLCFRQLCDLVLAIGTLWSLAWLRSLVSNQLLGTEEAFLVTYAQRNNITEAWSRDSWGHCVLVLCIWAGSTIARVIVLWSEASGASGGCWRPAIEGSVFAVAGLGFAGSTYSIVHVCCACARMIDAFCTDFVAKQDVERSLFAWNTLQALLRKASGALEKTFMVLTTTSLVMLLLGVNSLLLHGSSEIWGFLSVLMLILGILLVLFKAAAVTEDCTRVPTLINSYVSVDDTDRKRHYLVEYITYSAAGFYVGEVRLTASIALKCAYLGCGVAFAVLTKVSSSPV